MNHKGGVIIGLLAITLIGGVIRTVPAFELPLWFDEADTWRSGVVDSPRLNEEGLADAEPMAYRKFFNWTNHFETAPLSFLLARLSTDLFGTDAEWAMRMPSLIAGILCIPMMFLLGRVVHSDALGLLGAALIAVDPNMVDQSQQARMYAVMMLLTLIVLTWSIHLLRDPWREPHERKVHPVAQWIGLGVAFGLLFSTSQFTVAVWVGVAAALVLLLAGGLIAGPRHPKMGKVIAGFFTAYVVGLAIGAVGVIHLFQRIFGPSGGGGDGAHLGLAAIAREIVVAAKDLIGLTPAGLIVYVLATAGIVLLFRRCRTAAVVLACVVLVNIAILFPFRKMHHFMDGRYLTILQPALFIGLGMFVLGWRDRPRLRRGAFVIVLAYLGLQTWQSTHLSHWRPQPDRYVFTERIIAVREKMQPGETAHIHPGVAVILGQYYNLPQSKTLFESLYDWQDHQRLDDAHVPADFDADAVWLIMGMNNYEGQFPRARQPLEMLAKHYGVKFDEATWKQHAVKDHVIVAKISERGIEMESYGVGD